MLGVCYGVVLIPCSNIGVALKYEVRVSSHMLPCASCFQGLFSRITFRQDLYLGGYRNLTLIGRRTGIDWGFVGCVKHLSVNGKQYDMRKGPYIGDAIHGADVGK